MGAEEAILYELKGQVAVITINRPERRNSSNIDVRQGLYKAWERFEKDDAAKVAILTGAGDKAFCAGMDLKEAAGTGIKIPPRGFVPAIGDSVQVSKPTIAAVNGFAMAGGWLLAQQCDLCVASDHATFAISEAKVGRGTPWATPLIHMLPQRVLMEVLMTGDFISAQRLYELGYVNKVVPVAQLMDEAMKLAERIAATIAASIRRSAAQASLSPPPASSSRCPPSASACLDIRNGFKEGTSTRYTLSNLNAVRT